MFISYGANSTSKAPWPTYSSSGKSSTVSQKRPQTEHCYGQHRANCSRHAVQQQQRNGRRRTCSFWPLPASDVQHYMSQNDDYQPSNSQWWDILAHVTNGINIFINVLIKLLITAIHNSNPHQKLGLGQGCTHTGTTIMPRPHRVEALSDDARLTSVCHVH